MAGKIWRGIRWFFAGFLPGFTMYSKSGIKAVVDRRGHWRIPESEYPKLWDVILKQAAEDAARDPYRRRWRIPERRQPQ